MIQPASDPASSPRPRVPHVYRELAAFLHHPLLPPARLEQSRTWWREVASLTALNFAIAMVLLVPLSVLSTRLGIREPDFGIITRYGFAVTLLVGAFAIPALEEFVFRFWLDGRPRSALAVAVPLAAALGIALAVAGDVSRMAQAALLAGGVAATIAVLAWRLRRAGAASPWFARHFGWFYFASAIAFALAHLGNYPLSTVLTALPMVTPQLVAGLITGFARVRYGYGGGLFIHVSSNALAFALVFSGV